MVNTASRFLFLLGAWFAPVEAFAMNGHNSSSSAPTNYVERRVPGENEAYREVDNLVETAHQNGSCKRIQEKCNYGGCADDNIPLDALKGMTSSFARSVCGRVQKGGSRSLGLDLPGLQEDPFLKVVSAAPGQYARRGSNGPVEVLNSDKIKMLSDSGVPASLMRQEVSGEPGIKNLAKTFAIIAALPAQESDYAIGEGVDKNKTGEDHGDLETQEAGMFQTSSNAQNLFNSVPTARKAYQSMLNSYLKAIKAAGSDTGQLEKICMTDRFVPKPESGPAADKAKAVDSGALLQQLASASGSLPAMAEKLSHEHFILMQKSCPAYSTEMMGLLSRVTVDHHGPLKRGDIRPAEGCTAMFEEVAQLVKKSSNICREAGLYFDSPY